MSQNRKIRVYFKTQDGKRLPLNVDVNKSVDRMIADFLETKNKILERNDYSFIVNSIPLTKDRFLNQKVKYIKQLKPDCTIQVRYIKNVDGSLQANHKI